MPGAGFGVVMGLEIWTKVLIWTLGMEDERGVLTWLIEEDACMHGSIIMQLWYIQTQLHPHGQLAS